MEMSYSQDRQITQTGKIYIQRQTHARIYTQYILVLHVWYFKAQLWSLKQKVEKGTLTSMWDRNNSKLNNSTETSK